MKEKTSENLYVPDTIRTVSGRYVNIMHPTEEMISIIDIAHSLSRQCRFAGHLPEFYSVASHSINCASLFADPELRLTALMHDASEAYLVDIPRPIKPILTNYKDLEDKMMHVIAERFGFIFPFPKEIHEADNYILQKEWDCLMLGSSQFMFDIKDMPQTQDEFLNIFYSLKKQL